jgi:hypothetical protein
MSIYDLYKPLRNELRRCALIPSLRAIWAWIQHLQFTQTFPADIQVPWEIVLAPPGPKKGIYEWELAILAKELILNAPWSGSADLRSWPRFATTVNRLKNLHNGISAHYAQLLQKNILVEVSRIAHEQFGWQTRSIYTSVTRYLMIFSRPSLDAILKAELGISAQALYTIGLAMTGHFFESFEMNLPVTFSIGGVTRAQVDTFLARFSAEMNELRARCEEKQSYDQDFIYSLNPLKVHPLVRYSHGGRQTMIAPVPNYLIQRFTDGVFYEVASHRGFDSAFGAAFQWYVGQVLEAVKTERLSVLSESEYHIGKVRKDSIDWIAGDDTGDLFIECKTKRMRQDAKFALLDLTPLEEEINKLADIVAQTYKTLVDGLNGRYENWQQRSLPVYPIVVTLEEWNFFGPRYTEMIESRLREVFQRQSLDIALLDEHPFTVCSVADFERLMWIVATKGIHTVMKEKVLPERRLWLLHAVLLNAFPAEFASSHSRLFPHALDSITGA